MTGVLATTTDRRVLLRAGAGLAACALGGVGLPRRAAATVAPLGVVDFDALTVARAQLDRLGSTIIHHDRVGIADFSQPSWARRFAIVDMVEGSVDYLPVTHGRGSDVQHDGWLKGFSDVPGSLASSRGAYCTGEYYVGKHDLSMRLAGLDPDNRNAEPRAIVVHGAWYAEPDMIARQGRLGRSEGCFAFGAGLLPMVLDRLGPGRLLFADRLSALALPFQTTPITPPQ